MKQFLYLFVGGFILYGWWNYANQFVSPSPMTIFLPLAVPVGLLCFCLAVIKINDRPFEIFILNAFRWLFSPKQRKWITGYAPEAIITMDPLESQQKKDENLKTESDLDSLAKVLDKQASELTAKQAVAHPAPPTSKTAPKNINLSVSDVGSVAQKQQQAQSSIKGKK